MVTFRSNNGRRNNFRRNDRGFKSNNDRSKFSSNFASNESFQRKIPGRNNHNASKLIDKYNNLAREALSSGDKILSENYFQHAEHFIRVLEAKGAQFNKGQTPKENVNSNDKTDQVQSNANGKEPDSSETSVATES